MTKSEDTIKTGMKFNKGKLRYSIIPMESVREVVKVSEYGAIKYEPNNWKNITDMDVYYDALMRHMIAWKTGETHDEESHLHHLAHAAWNALTLVWFAIQKGELDPNAPFNLEYLEKWLAEKEKIKAAEKANQVVYNEAK